MMGAPNCPFHMEVSKKYYDKWYKIWSEQSDETLEITALVRSIECVNGCIQYAYRDNVPQALPLEQTRECMKLSMGVMKNKRLELPTGRHVLLIPPHIHPLMDRSRDIYINAFKKGDEDALDEFYGLSKSHFVVIGKERIDRQYDFVRKHFTDLFTELWIQQGQRYIYSVAEFT